MVTLSAMQRPISAAASARSLCGALVAAACCALCQPHVASAEPASHFGLGALPAGATVTDDHLLRVDLAAAKALARRRSPILRGARAGIDGVKARLSEARSAWFPTIEASGFATVIPARIASTDGSSYLEDYDWTDLRPLATGQISLVQTLFTFGKLDALAAMARQGIQVAEATSRVVEAELDFQIERAYFGLVMASGVDELARKGREQLTKERSRLEALRDDGDETFDAAELIKLRVVEVEFEEKLRAALRARDLAQDALRVALDLDLPWRIAAADEELPEPAFAPLPVAAYETLAVANQPRELARRRGLLVRMEQVRLERNRLLPDLVLTARFAYTYAPGTAQADDSLADNPNNPTQSGAGLALRWRIDLFRQLERIEQTEYDMRREQAEIQVEQQKMRADVRNAVREMLDLGELSALHDAAQRAVRAQMTSAIDLADKGLGTRAAATTAFESYLRRRLAHAENLYRYQVAVGALSRAIGVDVRTMPAPIKAEAAPDVVARPERP